MHALDTNVLVRPIVGDEPRQADLARRAIQSAIEANLSLFVAPTVVLELEWVLRARYRFDRSQILETMSGLLASGDLEIGDESAVEVAVAHYRDSRADFADCLHAGMAAAADRAPLLTFDRTAAKVPGVELVTP